MPSPITAAWSLLRLAYRAVKSRSSGNHDFFYDRTAHLAALAFAAIDLQLQLKIAGVAIGAQEIGNGRTAGGNGLVQNFSCDLDNALPLGREQAVCRAQGMDARGKENFVGVNIANAGDDAALH